MNEVDPAVFEKLRELRPNLLKSFGNAVSTEKGDGTSVTKLDKWAELRIRELLAKVDPNTPVVGEEFGGERADRFWLVDPIDGTDWYIRGFPECVSQLALVQDGRVNVGVIYDFIQDALYIAVRGRGARRNGNLIHVSDRKTSQSIIYFESSNDYSRRKPYYQQLCEAGFVGNVVCNYAGGWKFSQLASGVIDGIICDDSWEKDWDVAPGSLLVEEAGGIIHNIGKSGYSYKDTNLIATTPTVHAELEANLLV
ncbi:inositol monophosphatase [Pseudofrankia sp. DC12]|uniref:inositol monophosphatase family protein n=1 Tax=Pseudofrankia sp. DC12 TaxID=683315 RepID=UPI000AD70274|nr:inositol monophosphatase [Pseudofrankia sp. DC12]